MFLMSVVAAVAQDAGVITCRTEDTSRFRVPIRLEPGKGLIVENANCGQPIVVLGNEQGYAKVKSWYSTGYVSAEFVQVTAQPAAPASFHRGSIECAGDARVPVYGDILGLSVIANLPCGQPIRVVELRDGSARIQIGERIGYLASNFVRLERDEVPTAIPSPGQGNNCVPNPRRVLANESSSRSQTQAPTNAESGARVAPGSKLYIFRMEGHLDGLLASEIIKKKLPLTVVMDEPGADYVLTGPPARYHTLFGGKDKNEGNIQLINVRDRVLIWATEAGDRSFWWGYLSGGGQRKSADRIIKRMKQELFPSATDPFKEVHPAVNR